MPVTDDPGIGIDADHHPAFASNSSIGSDTASCIQYQVVRLNFCEDYGLELLLQRGLPGPQLFHGR
jgi:hypothetical protein